MDYIHSVLTPYELLRLGTSGFNEILQRLRYMGAQQPRANAEFDIARDTGFVPPEPLRRLPPAFDFWERALADAPETLSLGQDESIESVEKRESGEIWRRRVREVSRSD
jgi:indoleamine 2,3-dioxygenase